MPRRVPNRYVVPLCRMKCKILVLITQAGVGSSRPCFGTTRGIHNKDDAVPVGLEEPLIDLAGEIVANSGAHFKGQDWGDRLRRSLGCHRTDRKDFVRRG